MNWLKRLFYACKIRFGTLAVKELEQLCAIYIEFQNPFERASWITLYGWKKLTRRDSVYLLELYLNCHTADKGLLQAKWLLENEYIRHAYLHGLCSRRIPLTSAEEHWFLHCGEPGAMRCLKYPLSEITEITLLKSGDFQMIDNYVICHVLSNKAETLLATLASDKKSPNKADEYRKILKHYFKLQKGVWRHELFTGFSAQAALFADERNRDFIMEVIEQCDIDNHVLANDIIRHMALEMSPKYLTWYLAYSYIADKDLAAELSEKGLSEHLQDMIAVSTQRRSIHELTTHFLVFFSDDWRDDEREAFFCFCREDDAQKRMTDLRDFLKPRFEQGVISPAMSAWVAAQCPELAKEVKLNLKRFKTHILERITLGETFLSHRMCADIY